MATGKAAVSAATAKPEDAAGLILAGGYSRRMGGSPKALSMLGGKTLLERLVTSFREAGVSTITVVTGHESPRLESACQALGVQSVLNPDVARGMFSSVQTGLRALVSGRAHAALITPVDAALITPVDAALVLPRTIRALTEQWAAERADHSPARVRIPSFLGKGGHPLLLPAHHWPAVLAQADSAANEGLRGWLRRLSPPEVLRIPLPDEGLLCDLDTPDDLRQAEAFLDATCQRSAPTLREAWQMLLLAQLPEELLAHSLLVARSAHRLWHSLAVRPSRLPQTIALCGGLLHDIARLHPGHAHKGGALLRELGWDDTALLVESHMDFPPGYFQALTGRAPASLASPASPAEDSAPPQTALAAACVYLADKYAAGAAFIPPHARFAATRKRWRDDPAALAAITARENSARMLEDHLAALLGRSPEEAMQTPSGDAAERQLMEYAAPRS
ncbi:NTP transferase domain-containing protein [Desulfovibrio sp. OttesenSCG-928-I05]|nr:NTP transferase domain-containing protein [Desulfovibrio sp. OttesenSCG-928-I05]